MSLRCSHITRRGLIKFRLINWRWRWFRCFKDFTELRKIQAMTLSYLSTHLLLKYYIDCVEFRDDKRFLTLFFNTTVIKRYHYIHSLHFNWIHNLFNSLRRVYCGKYSNFLGIWVYLNLNNWFLLESRGILWNDLNAYLEVLDVIFTEVIVPFS